MRHRTPALDFVFFLQGSRHHQNLHSFPTRRSSDLIRALPLTLPLRSRRVTAPLSRRERRSEEHTSELQSRFDRVCRLLLEKKKQATRRGSARTSIGSETARYVRATSRCCNTTCTQS